MPEKNMEKYEVYKSMNENLSKAMRAGFYYQAIFIEYAIMEDRCASVLKYAGVNYLNKKGKDISISEKLNRMRDNSAFEVPYVRKRITLELIEEIRAWKEQRDDLIHHLATIPYDHESIKTIAGKGNELVRILSNKVKSVNKYHDKEK